MTGRSSLIRAGAALVSLALASMVAPQAMQAKSPGTAHAHGRKVATSGAAGRWTGTITYTRSQDFRCEWGEPECPSAKFHATSSATATVTLGPRASGSPIEAAQTVSGSATQDNLIEHEPWLPFYDCPIVFRDHWSASGPIHDGAGEPVLFTASRQGDGFALGLYGPKVDGSETIRGKDPDACAEGPETTSQASFDAMYLWDERKDDSWPGIGYGMHVTLDAHGHSSGTRTYTGTYEAHHTLTWDLQRTSADRPDAGLSSLVFADGALRFVPGDGAASTRLLATVVDDEGEPMTGRRVRLKVSIPADARGWDFTRTKTGANAACPDATNGQGEAPCTVKGDVAGPIQLRLIDVASGLALGAPVLVELTRKVVVLAMGFLSSLDGRFCYFGAGTDSNPDGPGASCEGLAPTVMRDQGTVYGRLVGGLRYNPDRPFATGGASVLNVSWKPVDCGDLECVAEVQRAPHGDVGWRSPAYRLGGFGSAWNQARIDSAAERLVNTLRRYDLMLATRRGIHASFYLVGHSMGGELMVRALVRAVSDDYLADPEHRGILPTVISVDGVMNWDVGFSRFSANDRLPAADRVDHCGSWGSAEPSDDTEQENVTAVDSAHALMGTMTVALTDGNDWVAPVGPPVVDQPVTLLSSPVAASAASYRQQVYWGYGAGKRADPPGWKPGIAGCAHSTLLRSQRGGLYLDQRWRKPAAAPRFPLGALLDKYVGRAAGEP